MQSLPTIVDLEASGFGAHSYPIEIGVALPDGQTACYLIRPETDWVHWDETSAHLHGLSRNLLLQHGKPVREVARALNDLLGQRTVYTAWGVDQTWLTLLYECAQVRQWFHLESLQVLFSEAQYAIWNEVKAQIFAECQFQRHRASNDARVIQMTYQRTRQLAQVS